MRGLIDGKGKLNTAHIVKYYGLWYRDGPFDIGLTTRKAMKTINPDQPRISAPRKTSAVENKNSLSNGSLMRITPLAVWS